METTKIITYDEIVSLMEENYSLYFVDYREDLSERLECVQNAIHGEENELWCITEDWDIWEVEKEILSQLKNKVSEHFKIDEDEAQELIDEHENNLRDEIHERDDSTPLKDLIRNTGDQVLFYDTGAEIGDMYADLKERVRDVKKAIKIPQKNKEFDSIIEELVENATYGGRLVIYFRDSLKEWIELDDDINTIKFSNIITVAVINNGNGSGFDVEMKHEFTMPFNRKNVFIDKVVKYSYVYDVCGLDPQWCKKTDVSLLKRKTKKVAAVSEINNHIENVKELGKTFKNGLIKHKTAMTTYERIIQLIKHDGYYIFKETYVSGQTTYDIVKNTGPGERSTYCRIAYNLVGRIVKETGKDIIEGLLLCVACNFTPEIPKPNHVIIWHLDTVESLF